MNGSNCLPQTYMGFTGKILADNANGQVVISYNSGLHASVTTSLGGKMQMSPYYQGERTLTISGFKKMPPTFVNTTGNSWLDEYNTWETGSITIPTHMNIIRDPKLWFERKTLNEYENYNIVKNYSKFLPSHFFSNSSTYNDRYANSPLNTFDVVAGLFRNLPYVTNKMNNKNWYQIASRVNDDIKGEIRFQIRIKDYTSNNSDYTTSYTSYWNVTLVGFKKVNETTFNIGENPVNNSPLSPIDVGLIKFENNRYTWNASKWFKNKANTFTDNYENTFPTEWRQNEPTSSIYDNKSPLDAIDISSALLSNYPNTNETTTTKDWFIITSREDDDIEGEIRFKLKFKNYYKNSNGVISLVPTYSEEFDVALVGLRALPKITDWNIGKPAMFGDEVIGDINLSFDQSGNKVVNWNGDLFLHKKLVI